MPISGKKLEGHISNSAGVDYSNLISPTFRLKSEHEIWPHSRWSTHIGLSRLVDGIPMEDSVNLLCLNYLWGLGKVFFLGSLDSLGTR